MQKEKMYIYGKNALMEALTHTPQVIKKVHLATSDKAIEALLSQHGISVAPLGKGEDVSLVGRDAAHQGVIAVIDASALMRPLETFLESCSINEHTMLVLFDEVQDPHNVGAIIRSAAAFGAAGVLFPEHNQAQVTGAVAKVSAGMIFRVPLVRIGNVNQTIRILKDRGFWIYGLDMKGEPLQKEQFTRASVFVVGNEGEGIREKTQELCDIMISIPMHTRTESLNAAVASSVVLYQWSTQHAEALTV